jgi:hypothetical protein
MMNIRLKQLAAQACLALGLIMSNARSMDDLTHPLPSATYTAARQAQMHAAAQSIMDSCPASSSRQAALGVAQLFADGALQFFYLLWRIAQIDDDAVHAGAIKQDSSLGQDIVLCGQNSIDSFERCIGTTHNPIRQKLARALDSLSEDETSPLDEGTRILANVVAHYTGEVPTITCHCPYERSGEVGISREVDLIAVKSYKDGQWQLHYLVRKNNWARVAYAAYTGTAVITKNEDIVPGAPSQACVGGRTLGQWSELVALASKDVPEMARDILRKIGEYPAEGRDTQKGIWAVNWPVQAE